MLSGGGRSLRRRGGCGRGLALLRLVLGAEPVRGHLLQAPFPAARLVAGLRQITRLPLVVVEEAIALRLGHALASLEAARLPVPLGARGTRLAALGRGLWHPVSVRQKKDVFCSGSGPR